MLPAIISQPALTHCLVVYPPSSLRFTFHKPGFCLDLHQKEHKNKATRHRGRNLLRHRDRTDRSLLFCHILTKTRSPSSHALEQLYKQEGFDIVESIAMQILRWLFKGSREEAKGNSCGSTDSKSTASDQESSKSKNIVLFGKSRRPRGKEKAKPGHSKFTLFAILCRKDVAKACFYSTINLRKLGSLHRRQNPIHTKRMKKEDMARGLGIIGQKADSGAAHGGNKVLPISDSALTSSATSAHGQPSSSEKKEKVKGDKVKAISRMKELLRWAAASKAEKGGKFISRKVLQFRQRGALKAMPDDDQFSNESPKISFRWDVESCSTISTSYSAFSLASARIDPTASRLSADSIPSQITDQCLPRRANWITTDTEFVVLEL